MDLFERKRRRRWRARHASSITRLCNSAPTVPHAACCCVYFAVHHCLCRLRHCVQASPVPLCTARTRTAPQHHHAPHLAAAPWVWHQISEQEAVYLCASRGVWRAVEKSVSINIAAGFQVPAHRHTRLAHGAHHRFAQRRRVASTRAVKIARRRCARSRLREKAVREQTPQHRSQKTSQTSGVVRGCCVAALKRHHVLCPHYVSRFYRDSKTR